MSDNSTAHSASEYEVEVKKTIPFHDKIIETAIDVALTIVGVPTNWLDTGAGPGELVARAQLRSSKTEFFIADPSEKMLEVARARLPEVNPLHFISARSQDLPRLPLMNVITAIQCHHYGDVDARRLAIARCYEQLSAGGALVVFENVYAETEAGQCIQRARWANWLRGQGRTDPEINRQLAREGVAFFPMRVSEHMALFRSIGFRDVELIWRTYGQAGFSATK